MNSRIVLATLLVWTVACSGETDPNNANNTDNTNNVNNSNDINNEETLRLNTLIPSNGSVSGGTSVALTGTGFVSGMTVTFGDAAATDVVVITPRTATAVTPEGMGSVDVGVTNPMGETVTKMGAFTYVEGRESRIGFCQLQAQSPARILVGADPDPLYAIVFAEGLTTGAGQGEFVEGELGWGAGPDVENYTFKAMTYNEDKDGLNLGDLSNDEYGAVLDIPTTGSFKYVARFKTQQSVDWIYCDLDGSENGISEDQLGVVNIIEAQRPQVGFCELFAQSPVSATTGQATGVLRAQVFVDGVTQGAGAGSSVEGELGYGAGAADQYTYTGLTYESDLDGLTQGDLANDQYGASLTVAVPGTYGYGVRFRVGGGEWTYCDLDGSDSDGTNNPGVLVVEDPAVSEITFCQTETLTATALANQDSAEITALVFAPGVTVGAGSGASIDAEIVWGAVGTAPSSWTDMVTAGYKEDVDGLTQGDLANDRLAGVIPAGVVGDYEYAMRVRLDGGAWLWCDTDGSQGASGAFEPGKVGALSVTNAVVNLPDACNTQFPQIHNKLLVGDTLTVYGRVTEVGSTGSGIAVGDLVGELLVGPQGADPETDVAMFTVAAATVRATADVVNPAAGEDEYQASFTASTAGSYTLAYRFTVDGGSNWSYCDIDGTNTNSTFQLDRTGVAQVYNAVSNPDLIDYCRVWQTSVTTMAANSSPVVTVETFEAGLTDAGTMTSEIEAQVGYGPPGANPAVASAYTWNATMMPYKGVGPSAPNNWEYEGGIYPDTAKPALGSYSVAVRVRRTGGAGWVYCDTLNTTMDFFVDQTTSLTVN